MSRTNRRLIITLGLLVFGAIGVLVLRITVQRGPQQVHETPQKQETRQIQSPPQTEPPQEQEQPRQEQRPRQQATAPQVQEQQEPPQEEEPHPRVVADVSALRAQLDDYNSRNGAYPTTAQGLSVLGVALKDPWGRDYVYNSPSIRNRESYDLFSAGPDGRPDTPDDDWGELGDEVNPKHQ